MGEKLKPELHFEYFVVCFIDLLGQSNHLKKWSSLPTSQSEKQTVKSAIFDSVGSVLRIKQKFEDFFYSLENEGNLNSYLKYIVNNDVYEQLQRSKECKLGIQQFSDSFVFYAPLINSHGDRSIAPLVRMLSACAVILNYALESETPMRGAVTIGTGVELQTGNFYGPALARAYEIERLSACYPRVLIDFEVEDFINKGQYSDHQSINLAMSGISSRICKNLMYHEKLEPFGYAMVDFLGSYVESLAEDEPEIYEQATDKMFRYVNKEYERYQNSNIKLAYKYRRLLNYMKERRNFAV